MNQESISLVIFLIIALILTSGSLVAVVCHLLSNNRQNKSKLKTLQPIVNSGVSVGNSRIAGRGVFARRDYLPGDLIEICPLIKDQADQFKGTVNDYTFAGGEKNGVKYSVLPFGYCALVNHSTNPNAEWRIDSDMMHMYALKKIAAGDEIFHNYQDIYWTTRKQKLGWNNISSGFN